MQLIFSLKQALLALGRRRMINMTARVVILGAIVWWIVAHLDLGEALRLLAAANPFYILLMIIASLIFGCLGGLKVWTLLRALSDISLRRTIPFFFVASSIGTFTPASLGDFSLAAFLQREQVPAHDGLAVVLIDRFVTFSLYVLLFLPLTLMVYLNHPAWLWLPVLYFCVGVGLMLLNTSARVRAFVRTRLALRYIPRAYDFLRTCSRLTRMYPFALLANVGVGMVRCLAAGMVVWLALTAVGATAPFVGVVSVTNALSVINLLPVSFGGLGVYEGGGVLLFEALGLNPVAALAALVLQRAYVLVSSTIILGGYTFVALWHRRRAAMREARIA